MDSPLPSSLLGSEGQKNEEEATKYSHDHLIFDRFELNSYLVSTYTYANFWLKLA